MDDVAALYDFVETEVIGYSYEGRKMQIIKICKNGCGSKPAIWIDGGIWCIKTTIYRAIVMYNKF